MPEKHVKDKRCGMKTPVLKVDPRRPAAAVIARAAAVIRAGGLVGFPTETVYGLAANRLDPGAIETLYKVKKRARGKPLTVHIDDAAMVAKMGCRMTKAARALTKRFWPGPLTVIVRSGSGEKIGFRMPANGIALRLIAAAKVPVVAPSANLSGNTPPKSARAVMKELGSKIDLVIDGGRTAVGVESTVVDCTVDPPAIVREGAIPGSDIIRTIKAKARNKKS